MINKILKKVQQIPTLCNDGQMISDQKKIEETFFSAVPYTKNSIIAVCFCYSKDNVVSFVKIFNECRQPYIVVHDAEEIKQIDSSKSICILSLQYMDYFFFDSKELLIHVEPSVTLEYIHSILEKESCYLPIAPLSGYKKNTIGYLLSNHIINNMMKKYYNLENYVIELEVVLANGEFQKFSGPVLNNIDNIMFHIIMNTCNNIGIIVGAKIKVLSDVDNFKLLTGCTNNIDLLINKLDAIKYFSTVYYIQVKYQPFISSLMKKEEKEKIEAFDYEVNIQLGHHSPSFLKEEADKIIAYLSEVISVEQFHQYDGINLNQRQNNIIFNLIYQINYIGLYFPTSRMSILWKNLLLMKSKYGIEIMSYSNITTGMVDLYIINTGDESGFSWGNFVYSLKQEIQNFISDKDGWIYSYNGLSNSLLAEHGGVTSNQLIKYIKKCFDPYSILQGI